MSRLFQPLTVGLTSLDHRVAMAPLTRYRWGDDWDTTGMKSMIIGILKQTTPSIFRNVRHRQLTSDHRVLRTESMCPRHTYR
jgi:hypothetical protein